MITNIGSTANLLENLHRMTYRQYTQNVRHRETALTRYRKC